MSLSVDLPLRRLVSSTFKFHGFSLKEDACSCLVEQLRPFHGKEIEEWLNKIVELVQSQNLETSSLSKNLILEVLEDCARRHCDSAETVLNVISAFDVPKFEYNTERKRFVPSCLHGGVHLFDSAKKKAFLFQDRYSILLERTRRHELFAPTVVVAGAVSGDGSASRRADLWPVERFLSAARRVEGALCLGLLCQPHEGRYCLEDPTGLLPLDLSHAKYHTGLYTENCFVLAEGTYEDTVFHVNQMGLPPPEVSKMSRIYFGNSNTFGGPSTISLKSSTKLLKYEEDNADEMMVFVSDVWLDDAKVLEKLTRMFQGFVNTPPVAFVLMGNFLSCQYRASHTDMLRSKLRGLADILSDFPDIVNRCKFIFVPGPADCGIANILPRAPLPQWVIEEFQQSVPSSIFTTNPCRIQYCTKEIVVIREDLVTKMCRNTVHFPAGDIPQHFAKTIVCQSHLTPLPLNVCPVYWSLDTAQLLYPLPDLIVTADKFSPFTISYSGCHVINPGSFLDSEFSFKVYIPAEQVVEDSQIPEDT